MPTSVVVTRVQLYLQYFNKGLFSSNGATPCVDWSETEDLEDCVKKNANKNRQKKKE